MHLLTCYRSKFTIAAATLRRNPVLANTKQIVATAVPNTIGCVPWYVPWYVPSFQKRKSRTSNRFYWRNLQPLHTGAIQWQRKQKNGQNDVHQIESSSGQKIALSVSQAARFNSVFKKLVLNILVSSRSTVPSEDPNGC